jgi:hypothetical protein
MHGLERTTEESFLRTTKHTRERAFVHQGESVCEPGSPNVQEHIGCLKDSKIEWMKTGGNRWHGIEVVGRPGICCKQDAKADLGFRLAHRQERVIRVDLESICDITLNQK